MSELYFIENYKDLLTQIDIHEKILDNAMEEQKYYQKQFTATWPHDVSGISSDGMPHGNFSPISLDRVVENLYRCQRTIEVEENILSKLRQMRDDINTKIHELEGIYFKVAYKRGIEGKTYKLIADELGYTEDYIRHIGAEINKAS